MKIFIISICLSTLLLSGCTSMNAFTRETKISSASIGALACGSAGALIGGLVGQSVETALIGGASGAALCGGVGYYFDQQEETLRKKLESTGVRVVREGEMIRLVMPSNILFASNRWQLKKPFHAVLDSIKEVLTEYDNTEVFVQGHTDSIGAKIYNLKLSKRRATAVADYLVFKGIQKNRILLQGLGEQQPISSNATDQGRSLNRRVEILIKSR